MLSERICFANSIIPVFRIRLYTHLELYILETLLVAVWSSHLRSNHGCCTVSCPHDTTQFYHKSLHRQEGFFQLLIILSPSYLHDKYLPGGAIAVRVCVALGTIVPFKVGLARFLLTAAYLSFGSPLGVESPTLHICAAVSSSLYGVASVLFTEKYFPQGNVATMVIVGCTCGLSAAFNTPLGGILYAMEEFKSFLAQSNVLTTLITLGSLTSVAVRIFPHKKHMLFSDQAFG